MSSNTTRFDMLKPPVRQKWYLKPLAWILSYPTVIAHGSIIKRTGTEKLKPPYLLLCSHNAFMDFKVTTAAIFPHSANYVVAIDGFVGREKLLRNVGCICKRKFTNDITLIRQLKRVIENGDIAVIYPEARYSLCGTASELPESLGKLVKMLGVPAATLIMHGHHINSPFWNLHDRGVKPVEAEFELLCTAEELPVISVKEINDRLNGKFKYDDYSWQKNKGIRVTYNKRAEGLHKVLYKCPACGTEYAMKSEGIFVFCGTCGKKWEMKENGELEALQTETEFRHIPDWYEWERAEVRKEIENGTYCFESEVRIDSLPNAKGYIDLGKGHLSHGPEGFILQGTDIDGKSFELIKKVSSLYACHIEYNYLGKKGDCIDLNTLNDTYYVYPCGDEFSVTKIALAVEEMYAQYRKTKPRRNSRHKAGESDEERNL